VPILSSRGHCPSRFRGRGQSSSKQATQAPGASTTGLVLGRPEMPFAPTQSLSCLRDEKMEDQRREVERWTTRRRESSPLSLLVIGDHILLASRGLVRGQEPNHRREAASAQSPLKHPTPPRGPKSGHRPASVGTSRGARPCAPCRRWLEETQAHWAVVRDLRRRRLALACGGG
jgi:hypothetical protein